MSEEDRTRYSGRPTTAFAMVAATGCATASEYVRRLIHADQLAQEKASLERRLLERLEEPSTPLTDQDWSEIRREVRRKLEAKRNGR